MIGTEAELAAKRCTPALVIYLLDALNIEIRNGLAAGGAQVGGNCIGSKCAQWCWFDHTRDGAQTYGGNQFEPGRAEPPGSAAKAPRSPRGYCGFTGTRQ